MQGATAIVVADQEHPFVYIPDGQSGPGDIGGPTVRVESFEEGIEVARQAAADPDAPPSVD
jgi:hypothetical protein